MEIKTGIILIILSIIGISIGLYFFPDIISYTQLDLREYITEEDILTTCTNSSFDKLDQIDCINMYYVDNVVYKSCSDEGRGYKLTTQKPMTTINRGRGCCKDAAEYYSYFLTKLDIPYEIVTYDIENSTGHRYILAKVVVEDLFYEIRLDNDELIYQMTANV